MIAPAIEILRYPTYNDPFCILKKGIIPSAPLSEGGESALTLASSLIPCLDDVAGARGEVNEKSGAKEKSLERGLIHRLDTQTTGLLLIASDQSAYNALIASQKMGAFKKTYKAIVEHIKDNALLLGGFPPLPEAVRLSFLHSESAPLLIQSRFRPYKEGRRSVRPVTDDSGMAAIKAASKRVYKTIVKRGYKTDDVEEKDMKDKECVLCTIENGFRHQVRCHLSWLGIPVAGDALYNSNYKDGYLHFRCVSLSFPHPRTGKMVVISE